MTKFCPYFAGASSQLNPTKGRGQNSLINLTLILIEDAVCTGQPPQVLDKEHKGEEYIGESNKK